MRTLTSVPGNSQRLDGGAMFGNAPKALWTRWIEPDERNRIPLACRCLLVRDGDRTILFEAGIGAFFEPKLKDRFGVVEDEHVLVESLAKIGLGPADIDVIVLSHLHFDHSGGLLTPYQEGKKPELVFPNAHYVVGQRAWDRARQPHFRDRASFIPELQPLIEATGKLELVSGGASEVLGHGYRFHHSEGHTPGLLLAEIDMPAGPVVFAADLIPGTPWVHLPITMGYDRYPEKLIDEKRALLEELLPKSGRLFYTHDPRYAISGFNKDDRGRFAAEHELEAILDLAR
ncbi:MAG: MBL fold metallo-hydrolase [Deltaproteobacteria bacterium]|nr:MBL fold metallo-hydrolase [Deltaproteobacteria bacterium]